jgi:hypothetical protein
MTAAERRRYCVHNLERMAPHDSAGGPSHIEYAHDGHCYSSDEKHGDEGAITFAEMLAQVTGQKIVVLDGRRAGKIVWQSW